MMRSFGAGLPVSYLVQFAASLCCAAAVWRLWQRPAVERLDRVALTVFLSLLATPYCYAHDIVGYSLVLAAQAHQRPGWRIDILDVLLWLWPTFSGVIHPGVVLTPGIIALAAARTWFGLSSSQRPTRSAGIVGIALK